MKPITPKTNGNCNLGKDDNSKQMTNLINSSKERLESDSFVVVKVESDSEAYMHFAKICKFSCLH